MTTRRTYDTANLSELQLKRQGDRLFKAHKFEDAVKSYSAALIKDPYNYGYLMRRAKCYEHLKQWELHVLDWHRAVDLKGEMLDEAGVMRSVKSIKTNVLAEVVNYLKNGRGVADQQVKSKSRRIAGKLKRAHKNRWIASEKADIKEENEFLLTMLNLLKYQKKTRLAKLRRIKKILPRSQINAKLQKVQREYVHRLKLINKMYEKVKQIRKNRTIPDHLCCPISFEIFKNPVITPCGITYDRDSIVKHLDVNGPFDPTTRAKLTEEQLIPNRQIIKAVDYFVAANQWAKYA